MSSSRLRSVSDIGIANRMADRRILTTPTAQLSGERLLAAEAFQLLICIDRDIAEARAQFNSDWFRRLMRIRPRAMARLQRRWQRLNPSPWFALGSLRRRYHANIARYLYEPQRH